MSASSSRFVARSERVISLKEVARSPSSPAQVTGTSSSSWSRATRRVACTSAATGRTRWWRVKSQTASPSAPATRAAARSVRIRKPAVSSSSRRSDTPTSSTPSTFTCAGCAWHAAVAQVPSL